MNIILSHYNEDLSWIRDNNLKQYNFIVYSKTNKSYNYIEHNKGQEAISYLKYIIDFYNKLPEYNIFLHSHNMSYHQDYHMCDILKRFIIPPSHTYISLNRRDYYNYDLKTFHTKEYNFLKNNWAFSNIEVPEKLSSYCCAQFYVNKRHILNRSLDEYINMYNWLIETTIENFWSSRMFEYMWYKILTNENEEPKLEYNTFLS